MRLCETFGAEWISFWLPVEEWLTFALEFHVHGEYPTCCLPKKEDCV
jgi:hypothetical protein